MNDCTLGGVPGLGGGVGATRRCRARAAVDTVSCAAPSDYSPQRIAPRSLAARSRWRRGCGGRLDLHSNAGLVLSHYDAKAHLVVARRVIDSLTPGWRQIGAVWLPLPHLINLLPVQIDLFYRTGMFASAVSMACLGITVWASARLNLAITGSSLAAVTSTALLLLNPNLLYLHVTPMTEPLFLAILFLSTLWMFEWTLESRDVAPWKLGCVLFAAAWTRYEAWPVMAAALAATTYARWRGGVPARTAVVHAVRLASWPAGRFCSLSSTAASPSDRGSRQTVSMCPTPTIRDAWTEHWAACGGAYGS